VKLEGVLFIAFLGISFLIGALASRSVKSVSDYFVAGARMPWFFIVGTFVASNVSAGLFLGATNMTAVHGYAMWCAYFTTSIGFVLGIAVVGVLVRRLASHYEIYDFADILATRYCSHPNAVRALTTAVVPIVYIPLLAAQLIGLATIAGSMLDLPYQTVLSVITLMVVLYTMLGGMLGVVWTDGFQFMVLLVGMILAVPIAMTVAGDGFAMSGWQRITEMPQDIFKGVSPSWPWHLVLGQFVWLFSIPVQPHLVTRFLTARDERSILIALPVCVTAGLIIFASTVPVGLLGKLTTPDLASGGYYYVELARHSLGPWLGAFALAGIAAAALSTCSTILIVTGQSLSREVYQKLFVPEASEKQALAAARVAVLLVGLLTFGIAWHQPLGIFWLVVLSASLLASIFFVPLFVGFFMRSASAAGALASMIAGGLAVSVVFVLNEWFDSHFFVNELFAGLIASALAMWGVSRRYPATMEERQVLDTLARQSN
jgi:sodium/proline symporter